MLVKNKIKEYIKNTNVNMKVSKDFYEQLEEEVKLILNRAIVRAELNKRKTIKPQDV